MRGLVVILDVYKEKEGFPALIANSNMSKANALCDTLKIQARKGVAQGRALR